MFFACFFREGLTSDFIGQFTGFQIHHQHTGWGTSIYYPKIDPLAKMSHEVRVGVIDSGLAPNLDEEIHIGKEADVTRAASIHDQLGHGTKVASIIAAKNNHKGVLGLAPEAEIYSYKVVDDQKNITVDSIRTAIVQAIEDKVSLINISIVLSGELPEDIKQLLETYIAEGGYVVIPAYDMKDLDRVNPLVDVEGIISVGSFNDSFQVIEGVQPEKVDYYAPYSQEALSLN